MTKSEAKRFLVESRSVVRLGTLDASGDPNINPAWYYFDPEGLSLYAFVAKDSKSASNSSALSEAIRRMMAFVSDMLPLSLGFYSAFKDADI